MLQSSFFLEVLQCIQAHHTLVLEPQLGLFPALDLHSFDDTLADTRQYYFEKLYKQFGTVDNLSLEELIKKYEYTERVPAWQTPEVLVWIQEDSQLNQTQQDMPAVTGAVEAVNKINTVLPVRIYITSRPSVVVEGTKRWLAQQGFPEAEVVTRSLSQVKIHGNAWKAQILKERYPSIIGIVDDNPEIVDALGPDYAGNVYLYGPSVQQVTPGSRVFVCPTWDDVVKTITQ
jgi:hypothetical protein